MIVHYQCQHENHKKFGKDKHGKQRFRCKDCRKTFFADEYKPLGDMRIDHEKAVMVLRMLLEGNSIRSTERLTGIHRGTIMRLFNMIGHRCRLFCQARMKGLKVKDVQVDETWGFVACKEKTREKKGYGYDCGHAYVFTAVERDTKLLIAWHVGRREPEDTKWFTDKLREATTGRFQLSTDGFKPYCTAVPESFRGQVDFGQIVKIYRSVSGGQSRYSPGEITGIKKHWMWGLPDPKRICTSHAERHNLTIRMGVRRMTRLTNAFSKLWESHENMLALFFTYYNFCRVHMTLKTTPAVASGLADDAWSVENLLDELATFC